MKRLVPPILFLLCLLTMAVLHLAAPVARLLSFPVRWIALLPLLAGLALTISQGLRFERTGVNIHPFREPTALVTTGPFRFTRNPMYLGFVLALVGTWLLLGSLSPLVPVVAFFAACEVLYIPFEEKEMKRVHGAEYDEYRARVRRWL